MARGLEKPKRRRFGPGRSALRKANLARGRQLHNIWYHYSPRLKRDVALNGNAAFDHFCWLEGDPNVLRYELTPPEFTRAADGRTQRLGFDVLVEFRVGQPQLRNISSLDVAPDFQDSVSEQLNREAADAAGYDYVRISPVVLAEHAVAINNWRSALAFLASCREIELESHADSLLKLFRDARRATIDALWAVTEREQRPACTAALFRCAQDGRLLSDLALKPLCGESAFWFPECGRE